MLDVPIVDIVLYGEKNGLFSFIVDSISDTAAKPPWLLTAVTANGFPLALAENDFILSGNKNGFELAEEDMFMI